MSLEKFTNLIESLQFAFKRSGELNRIGINLIDYDEKFYDIINDLLEESFGQEGKSWIEWYLYDKFPISSGEPHKAFDKTGKEICYDIKSLWNTAISPNDK